MEYTHHYDSPLGGITLASDGEALTGLWFDGQKRFAASLGREALERMLPVFDEADRWLDIYFEGRNPDFVPEIRAKGSAFQMDVWKILCSIPYGSTTSYGEIAKKMAAQRGQSGMSAQAVGGAVGRNPVAIIIPCHRVLGKDGSLVGYAGGIEKKARLLEMEGATRHLRGRWADGFHL